ncbi:MAG: 4-hydroxy-3-methylbut-2-en-1-yl diphosphate synthase [bacterium ADurb.Bin243]|nr:MAG: 4-hydroxy-3-methylbut-2-en-1-yl diphosphate synthase [bacterium ADurb.Bin243]
MNDTQISPLDLKTVELCYNWPQREDFFNNFPNYAGLFTYRIRPEDIPDLKNYNIDNYCVVFESFEKYSQAVLPSISAGGFASIKGINRNHGALEDVFAFARNRADSQKVNKMRLCINCDPQDKNAFSSDEIDAFIERLFSAGTPDPERLSLCFQARRPACAIDFNRRLASRRPGVSKLMHIEPPEPLNEVENAVMFALKYGDPLLKSCSVAPEFAAEESGHGGGLYLSVLEILRSLEFSNIPGVFFISCPTCSRCRIDVISLAKKIYGRVRLIEKPLKIAVMGCEVNGPGEASHADVGVAGSLDTGVIFERGKIIRRVKAGEIEDALMAVISDYVK